MPSKGIDVFTWIGLRGWHVEYTVPKDGVTHDGFRAWKRHHLEVDTKNIDGFLGTKGPFAFIVKDDRDNVVLQKKNTISALDFDVDEGDMTTIPDMQSLVKENYVVTVFLSDIPTQNSADFCVVWFLRFGSRNRSASEEPYVLGDGDAQLVELDGRGCASWITSVRQTVCKLCASFAPRFGDELDEEYHGPTGQCQRYITRYRSDRWCLWP